MRLQTWRHIVGVATVADRWLADQIVSEQCCLRLHTWEQDGASVIVRRDSSRARRVPRNLLLVRSERRTA